MFGFADERQRRRYVSSVRRLMRETFGLTPNDEKRHRRVWERWVERISHNRGKEPLEALLANGNIHDAFKARALAILLAPFPPGWEPVTPYEYGRESLHSLTYHRAVVMRVSLSTTLQEYAVALVGHTAVLLEGSNTTRSRDIVLLNRHIIQLFALVGEPQHIQIQEKLFKLYKLGQDEIEYHDQYELGVHSKDKWHYPFSELLLSQAPAWVKERADAGIRAQIGSTPQRGKCSLYSKYCLNLRSLAGHLAEDPSLPYPEALLASQVEYVLTMPYVPEERDEYSLVNPEFVGQLLVRLKGDLRRRLVHAWLCETRGDSDAEELRYEQPHYHHTWYRFMLAAIAKEFSADEEIVEEAKARFKCLHYQRRKDLMRTREDMITQKQILADMAR